MRKQFLAVASAIAAMAFAACTDEKVDINLTVGQDGAKETTINRLGGTVTLPINTNGEWTATLSDDCDWAEVTESTGKGDKQLEIEVDYLNPSTEDADRMATLTVTAGDKMQTIRIRQYVGLEDGVNEAYLDETGFNDLYLTRGLGFGFNIAPTSKNITLTKNPIINKGSLDKLAKEDDSFKNIIRESTDPSLIGEAGPTEKFHHDMQSLGINADIEVTYGLFKLGIKGAYKMGQENNKQLYNFYSGYRVPRVMAILNSPDLESIADDEELYTTAFTRGFRTVRDNIIKQFEMEEEKASFNDDMILLEDGDAATWKKYRNLENALRNLDSKYGPAYIVSTTLGGNLTMEISCDTSAVMDTTKVHGEISTKITAGLLKVDVNVSADYAKSAQDMLKNGIYSFTVKGGSPSTQMGINEAMGINQAKIDFYNIQSKISEWINSIPNDLESKEAYENIAVYEQGLAPIWGLFPIEYQGVIRGYMLRVYKDKKTIIDLEDL